MWAKALAAGVPDEVFRGCTPAELSALMREMNEREAARQKAENVRAGLVAAAVYNVHRQKKTDHVWQPEDFFRTGPKVLTTDEMERLMTGWAQTHNAAAQA